MQIVIDLMTAERPEGDYMKTMIGVLFAAVLAVAPLTAKKDDNGTFPGGIVMRRDEPLQLTWFTPKRPPYSKSHEGLWHADTFSWRCYPIAAQSFKTDRKALELKIELDGPGNWSTNSVAIFAVDGDVSTIQFSNSNGFQTIAGNRGSTITFDGREQLIRKIAGAKEVWVTVPDGNTGERHSVKLSERQLETFNALLKVYDSLEQK